MTPAQPGSGLRSKKIDPKRPMTVLRFDQVEDLEELSEINRTLTKVSTGVEKEEEEEHHLKQALEAPVTKSVVIPTPDASSLVDLPNYEKYYTATFTLPTNLIKFSSEIDQVMGCLYNLTKEDAEWLERPRTECRNVSLDDFELSLYTLDELANSLPSKDKLTLELAIENLGAVDIELSRVAASAILEYFIFKRYEENDGEQLRPALKKEENVADADKDPYVCFRQREVKTERKMRRSDMLSMDKIRKLHEDLEKAKQLLDLVYEREVAQKDYIDVQQQLFGRRVQLRKLRSHFGIVSTDSLDRTPDLKPKKRSRQNDNFSTKLKIPTQSLREAAHLVSDMDSHLFDEKVLSIDQRIEENIKREKALNEKGGWVDCTEFPYRSSSKQELWGRHLGIEITSKELFAHTQTRRRVGRGGRIIFDRQTRLPGNDFMVNERDVISDPIPLLPCLEYLLLTSRPSFRAFEIGPKDEEYVSLQNHPTHNLIFDPQKSITDKDRRPPYLSPPQIVKLPLNPGHQTQRKKYPKSSAESRTSTKKKTPEVVLDPRAQAVKTMMRQAQQQAQQTQANLVMNNQTSPSSGFQVGNAGRVPTMFMNQQTPSTMSQLNMTNQSGLLRQQQMTQLYYSQMTPQGARQNSTPQTVLSYIGAPFQFPQQMIGMSPNMPVGIMNTPSNLNLSKTTSATSLPAQQELPEPDVVVPTTTDKENLVV